MHDSKDEFDALVKDIWFSERPTGFGGKWLKEVTAAAGISPDWIVLEGEHIRAVHRELADGDIYWVNSPLTTGQSAEISLRTSGLKPEKWNPMNGKVSDLSYRTDGDRTVVSLDFDPDDAFFIVFREKSAETSLELPVKKSTLIKELPVEGLGCWTEDPQTRYFSGTRSYSVPTEVPEFEGRLILDLGQVCNLAQVFVDGQEAGILWKAPFSIDITDHVRDRKNINLEIKVTNLWVNNLIGDALKEPSQKSSYVSFDFYRGNEPLLKSGLIGPVKFIQR